MGLWKELIANGAKIPKLFRGLFKGSSAAKGIESEAKAVISEEAKSTAPKRQLLQRLKFHGIGIQTIGRRQLDILTEVPKRQLISHTKLVLVSHTTRRTLPFWVEQDGLVIIFIKAMV